MTRGLYALPPEMLEWHDRAIADKTRIRAAVAIVFVGRGIASQKVLLTLRRNDLATHAGQVAFPGGMMEPSDRGDPVKTALRELQEEVGFPGEQLEKIQSLPPFPTVTGNFIIDPFIFQSEEEATLCLDPREVARAEFVALHELRKTLQYEERKFFGNTVKLPVFYWHQEKVWGVTAMLLASVVPELLEKE